MLGRFYFPEGVDLVNLGDIRAFMLANDNLYNICVHPGARQYPLVKHYANIEHGGYQPSAAGGGVLDRTSDPKFGIYLILDHLIRHDVDFAFLDIGSFVGDVGLRYGNYFRTLGVNRHVHCFDPTLAGQLVPYNIALNGLDQFVTYHSKAVSGVRGYVMFFERKGHSDASSAVDSPNVVANSIVPSIRLSDFIRQNNIQNAFIKLDTENQEPTILADLGSFLYESVNAVAFECHSGQDDVFRMMASLSRTHLLFDVGYVPKPFIFRLIPEGAGSLGEFRTAVAGRPYSYTDVLALSKTTPGVADLVGRLVALGTRPVGYSLVFDN